MAIREVDGRQVSVRTPEEDLKLLEQDLAELTPDEREVLHQMIQEQGAAEGSKTILQIAEEAEYERPVVPIEEWLKDDYYFGEITKGLYPRLKGDLIDLFNGDYHEAVLSGSIGWGKTTFADIALARQVYELSCMRNPARSLGLASGSQLIFAGISINEKIAQKVIFDGVAQKILLSPYFQKEFKPKDTQEELRFPKNIWIIPASAADNSLIGMNVVGAVIDESNFMEFTAQQRAAHARWGQTDKAGRLYNGILRRMKSRFLRGGKLPGLLLVVSSKKHSNAFTERKVKESVENPRIFVREYALWDVKKYGDKKFRVVVGTEDTSSRILSDEEPVPEMQGKARIVEVPVEFREDFEDDLDGALREIAGIATDAIRPFFRNREKIAFAFKADRKQPAPDPTWDPSCPLVIDWSALCSTEQRRKLDGTMFQKFVPRVNPTTTRHVHIDPSLKDDATGFVVSHVAGQKEVIRKDHSAATKTKEVLPIIYVDLALRIVPPEGGREIPLAAIRSLIYALTEHGFQIGLVTMDTYQSADMRQILVSRGYRAEILSVDTSPQPYEMLREAINQERFNCYKLAFLEKEVRQLEWDPVKKKVDHPPEGSKDLADGIAGTTFSLATRSTHQPMVATYGISEFPDDNRGDLDWVLPKNDRGQAMRPHDPVREDGPNSWVPLLPIKG